MHPATTLTGLQVCQSNTAISDWGSASQYCLRYFNFGKTFPIFSLDRCFFTRSTTLFHKNKVSWSRVGQTPLVWLNINFYLLTNSEMNVLMPVLPRLITQRDAPTYQGMSEPVFNHLVQLYVTHDHSPVAAVVIRSLKDKQ